MCLVCYKYINASAELRNSNNITVCIQTSLFNFVAAKYIGGIAFKKLSVEKLKSYGITDDVALAVLEELIKEVRKISS